ncbi:restriction endonuclease subunit S [Providencia stuartii]
MSEWQNVTLKQLVKFGNGKSRPKEKGKIPVYGGNGILDFTDKYNYAGETLIIGRVGAYCGATYLEKSPVWVSDNALSAKALDNNNPDYLYYLFKYLDLNQYAQGSSHPLLTQTLLNAIEVETTLDGIEQKAIASVLSSLDNKIDLLHRQNKTLESMAETLFRQWFVEEAQDDWEEVKVSHFVTLNKSSITKKYDHQSILYLETSSLTKGYISELKPLILSEAPSRAKRLVQHLDILISTVRPDQCHYGFCFKPETNLVVSTGFCTITCDTITPYFIYYLLTSEDMTQYLHSIAEGSTSTYPSLKPEDIGNVSFALPPKEKLNDYHNIVGAMWNKINQNQKQIQNLEKLRDTLLPKLMSGEVRVNYRPEEIKQ